MAYLVERLSVGELQRNGPNGRFRVCLIGSSSPLETSRPSLSSFFFRPPPPLPRRKVRLVQEAKEGLRVWTYRRNGNRNI